MNIGACFLFVVRKRAEVAYDAGLVNKILSPLSIAHANFLPSSFLVSFSINRMIRKNTPAFSSLHTSFSFSPLTYSISYVVHIMIHTPPNKPRMQRSHQHSFCGLDRQCNTSNFTPFSFKPTTQGFFVAAYQSVM